MTPYVITSIVTLSAISTDTPKYTWVSATDMKCCFAVIFVKSLLIRTTYYLKIVNSEKKSTGARF